MYFENVLYFYRTHSKSCLHITTVQKNIQNITIVVEELQKLKCDKEVCKEIKLLKNLVTNLILKCSNRKETRRFYKIAKKNDLIDKNFFDTKSIKGKILQKVLENKIGFNLIKRVKKALSKR